ncbi:hypothetical protein EC991_004758 [Linnemannia zychae]|nr:hypothetical protein EC991_004758 [Linnemannia zychae]
MTDNRIQLYCLVAGEATPNAFPVWIESTTTIGDLKKLIKVEKSPDFDDIVANNLTLWHATIPSDNRSSAITVDALDNKEELSNPMTCLSTLFPESPGDGTYIIVQRHPTDSKRDHEEDAGLYSMRKRHRPGTLMYAIEDAGLMEKAKKDDKLPSLV